VRTHQLGSLKENTPLAPNWDLGSAVPVVSGYIYIYIIEGSLEVKLPTIWTVEKQR